ncbi:protein eceriferum 1 [Phtheirospermum japonicum]|uniref:Protein eceriferum 1 n=1 Tax=Phtheirospermum japonicum TaxID=374723 RepID=A0A830C1N8_9LAMI|nr:protein eceriferum 1 [Phtheirospermum japonicum]
MAMDMALATSICGIGSMGNTVDIQVLDDGRQRKIPFVLSHITSLAFESVGTTKYGSRFRVIEQPKGITGSSIRPSSSSKLIESITGIYIYICSLFLKINKNYVYYYFSMYKCQ